MIIGDEKKDDDDILILCDRSQRLKGIVYMTTTLLIIRGIFELFPIFKDSRYKTVLETINTITVNTGTHNHRQRVIIPTFISHELMRSMLYNVNFIGIGDIKMKNDPLYSKMNENHK